MDKYLLECDDLAEEESRQRDALFELKKLEAINKVLDKVPEDFPFDIYFCDNCYEGIVFIPDGYNMYLFDYEIFFLDGSGNKRASALGKNYAKEIKFLIGLNRKFYKEER